MAREELALQMAQKFAPFDLSFSQPKPDQAAMQMGDVFEELIRIGAEQSHEEAGEQFALRKVFKLTGNPHRRWPSCRTCWMPCTTRRASFPRPRGRAHACCSLTTMTAISRPKARSVGGPPSKKTGPGAHAFDVACQGCRNSACSARP